MQQRIYNSEPPRRCWAHKGGGADDIAGQLGVCTQGAGTRAGTRGGTRRGTICITRAVARRGTKHGKGFAARGWNWGVARGCEGAVQSASVIQGTIQAAVQSEVQSTVQGGLQWGLQGAR